MRLALAVTLLVQGCTATPPEGAYACTASWDCPTGWRCLGGHCFSRDSRTSGDGRRLGSDGAPPGDGAAASDVGRGDPVLPGDTFGGDSAAGDASCGVCWLATELGCVPVGKDQQAPGCDRAATDCWTGEACDGEGRCAPREPIAEPCAPCFDCDQAGSCAPVPRGFTDTGCDAPADACNGAESCDGLGRCESIELSGQTAGCVSDRCSLRWCGGGVCNAAPACTPGVPIDFGPCERCGRWIAPCSDSGCIGISSCEGTGQCEPSEIRTLCCGSGTAGNGSCCQQQVCGSDCGWGTPQECLCNVDCSACVSN